MRWARESSKLFTEKLVDYAENNADGGDDDKIRKAEQEQAQAEGAHALELARLSNLLQEPRYQQLVGWLSAGALGKEAADKKLDITDAGLTAGAGAGGQIEKIRETEKLLCQFVDDAQFTATTEAIEYLAIAAAKKTRAELQA